MNILAYIESGILEEYVLGIVSPQEKQEVECMSHIYPEIKEELMRTESALEQYALKHQTPPPPSLKEALFAQMNFEEAITSPISEDQDVSQLEEADRENIIRILPVNETTEESEPDKNDIGTEPSGGGAVISPLWPKFAVAASVIFALLFGWSLKQNATLKTEQEEMSSLAGTMQSDMETLKKDVAYSESLAEMYRNPNHKVIRMAGLERSPESAVAAIWDVKTNEVLLDVQNLPAAPTGKQYQLWTIVDGKPVDMGVLDQEFSKKLLKMKQASPAAVAFAITLEKEGGSPNPTMEDMFVMGKV